MEKKKNEKLNLERKRPLFFGIGMVISLTLAITAFQWKTPIEPIDVFQPMEEEPFFMVIEEPIITKQEKLMPPKPIAKKQVVNQSVIINELKDDLALQETEDRPEIDTEIDFGEIAINMPAPKVEEPSEFLIVEDMPIFPGGDEALLSQIASKIRYPRQAQRMGIEGTVYLSFIIDKDGSITQVEILKGIGAGCDKEAARVMGLLPKFQPGKQRGKPVRVKMQVPIKFKLN